MRNVTAITSFILLLLIIVSSANVFAAVVEEKNSGLSRGSIAFTFLYDPADGPTIVEGARQNDLLVIIYDRTDTGVDIDLELFLKSRLGETWNYEIVKGERNLLFTLGQKEYFDLDGDEVDDIYVEYTNLSLTGRGTFTIDDVNNVDGTAAEDTAPDENVSEPEEDIVVIVDEETDVVDSGETPDDAKPVKENHTLLLIILTILVIIFILVVRKVLMLEH